MLATIVGSKYAGSFIKNANEDVLTILGSLDQMNDEATLIKARGMDHLLPFIDKIEGINGHKETFKQLKLYGVRDGEYVDAPTFKEAIESWFYTREGVVVKDHDFSLALIQDAYERDIPLQQVVTERLVAVGDWFIGSHVA